MKLNRLWGLVGAAIFAWAAACTGGGGDPGGAGPGGADGGSSGSSGSSGGGSSGGGSSGSSGSSGEAGPPAYTGGDVTVTIGDADGGAVDLGAVSGTVTIHMVPATPAAIAAIDALVDGNAVGTPSSAPYDVKWDSASVANGAHTVTARPHDRAGVVSRSAALAITTKNFLLAGKYQYSNVTDYSPGFSSDPCTSTSFTVTFDVAFSTLTLPGFSLSCKAQNGASYTSKIKGFSQVVGPAEYDGPITNKTGTVTQTFSATKLTQTDSFNGNTQSGTLTKVP